MYTLYTGTGADWKDAGLPEMRAKTNDLDSEVSLGIEVDLLR